MSKRIEIPFLYLTVFVTGAAVLVIEILGTRVLAPFYGSTIFVWSSLITVTLGALALGYFVGGYVADTHPKTQWFYGVVFIAGLLVFLFNKMGNPVLLWSDRFGFQWGPLVATLILFSFPLFFLGMVTPFAIRLRAISVEHTGHTSGTIFAIATIGSVAGALFAGFYLIPNFFVANILFFSALLLIAVSLAGLSLERTKGKFIALALLLALAAYFFPYQTQKVAATILYEEPSFYGDIKVVEKDSLRCLIVGSQGQSCINRESGEQTFAYGAMIADFLSDKERESALVIGFGGGVLARDLLRNFKLVDGVEIDPKIIEAAKMFFGYDESDPRLQTFIADGRKFLRSNAKKYDAIVLDAFSGVSPAPHLYTKEAFADMKNRLKEGGLLLVNTIGYPYGEKARLQRSLFATLRAVFPEVIAMATEGTEENSKVLGNIVFAASDEKISFPFPNEFLVQYGEKSTDDAVLLSDAKNPLDILGLPIFEESRDSYRKLLSNAL